MAKASKPVNPAYFPGAITEDDYLYGDGRGETKAIAERESLIILLRTKWQEHEKAQALADKLEACKPGRRCLSGACPECARAAQVLFSVVVSGFLENVPNQEQIVCMTIVPHDGGCGPRELDADYARRNIRRWKERLARAGVPWFVGAVDYSANEHAEGRYEDQWSEHFCGFTSTADPEGLKKNLRKQFLKTDAIPRPVTVKPWDGSDQAILYTYKPNFWRRVATDEGERGDGEGGTRICRDTDPQRLKSKQRARLAMYLDELGLNGRLVFRCAQFINHGNGFTEIVKRGSQAVGAKIVKTPAKPPKKLM
jgi:hypothetical protein